jgi:enterochelin esterase family protein
VKGIRPGQTPASRYLDIVSMLSAAASARVQSLDPRTATEATGERFEEFLARVAAAPDTASRKRIVREYTRRVVAYGRAVVEQSVVYFLFQGKARRVSVPSDLNGWSPSEDSMSRIPGTDLFVLRKTIDQAARFEYKFLVGSTWILDPFNQQQTMGGHGPNSEIWMPCYRPPREIEYREEISHGAIDTLAVRSKLLGRTHPVFVYVPAGYRRLKGTFPTLFVTDGGEYLSLALMANVLDNIIAEGRIPPVVCVFVDPRTDIRDSKTSKRSVDYTMNATFVSFLITEVRAGLLRKKYRLAEKPEHTGIMGASLGGLISTFAAFSRPDVFGLCAAQSPAYWWDNGAILRAFAKSPTRPIRLYIDTGTVRDAREHSMKMKNILEEKGYEYSYAEYPESHNWGNWRARIADILVYFWGVK